jgi:hypothetical protein
LNVYPTNGQFQIERTEMSPPLKGELEQLKKLAQDLERPVPSRFIFRGFNLKMQAKGGDGFNWILKNNDIALAVNRSSKMQLWGQARCSSQYLQTIRDLGSIISEVHIFLMTIFGQLIILQPSALDIAVDVAFLDLGTIHDVKKNFVTRAQLTGQLPADERELLLDGPSALKERWGRLTGLPFGSRTGAVSALIYDKTHEIKYHSPEKSWMVDIWEQEAERQNFCLLKSAQIWRIELRFKRPALNEMAQKDTFHGINDAYELEAHLPGLWSYAVGHLGGSPEDGLPDGWLRYIIPSTDDINRSRWLVHPDWSVIQSAFAPVPYEESDYEREQHEREEILNDLDAYLALHPDALPHSSHSPQFQSSTAHQLSPFQPFGPSALAAPTNLIDLSEVPAPPAPPDDPASAAALPVDLVPYVRKRKHEVNMRRLVAQIAGCLITAEAWRKPASPSPTDDPGDIVEPDISSTVHYVYALVESYLQEKKRDFSEAVHKKRILSDLEQTLARLDESITSDATTTTNETDETDNNDHNQASA